MRRILLAVAALFCGVALAAPALGQDDNGAGLLPGVVQPERKLGGPGAGYVCTATNALRTRQCSVSCPTLEAADCEDADGGGAPTCQCGGG